MAARKTKLKNASQRKVHRRAYQKGYRVGERLGYGRGYNAAKAEFGIVTAPVVDDAQSSSPESEGGLSFTHYDQPQNVAIKELTDRLTRAESTMHFLARELERKSGIIVNVNGDTPEMHVR